MKARKHQVPPALRDLIRLGNMLGLWSHGGSSPDRTLPSFHEYYRKYWRERREEWTELKKRFAGDQLALGLTLRGAALDEILSAFPGILRNYVNEAQGTDGLTDLDALRHIHNTLISYEELYVRVIVVQEILDQPRSVSSIFLPGIQKLIIPRQGRVQQILVEDPLIKTINVERIRSCEFCSMVFWAERTDAVYCSQKCGKAKRQQRWRDSKKLADSRPDVS